MADVTAVDLPRRARVACDDRPTFLVLDNFEQVLDAAPLVADLLISATTLRLLVTSRAPLRVRGERGSPWTARVGGGLRGGGAGRFGARSRGAPLRGAGARRAA